MRRLKGRILGQRPLGILCKQWRGSRGTRSLSPWTLQLFGFHHYFWLVKWLHWAAIRYSRSQWGSGARRSENGWFYRHSYWSKDNGGRICRCIDCKCCSGDSAGDELLDRKGTGSQGQMSLGVSPCLSYCFSQYMKCYFPKLRRRRISLFQLRKITASKWTSDQLKVLQLCS